MQTLKIEFRWVRQAGRFQRGENLMVGKWIVGSISPDVVRSADGDTCVYCSLPGIKKQLKNRAGTDMAKQSLENAVRHWFQELQQDAQVD